MNLFREKLNKQELIGGTLISLSEPTICDIIGTFGFDFVWIDMEHTYLTYQDVQNHIITARGAGMASLVRMPVDDYTAIKKVCEMGPDAILFPMVTSVEQAKQLIDATLYPPYGTRGFGPMRAVRYGKDDVQKFIDNGHKDLCRFIQIEHKNVVEELEEYVKNEYIDGYIFGPNDLSGSINKLGHMFCEENTELMRRATDILKKYNKRYGVAVTDNSLEGIKFWKETYGMDIICAGADWAHIFNGSQETINNLNKIRN